MRHVKEEYHDVVPLKKIYKNNKPFPHIVLDNFVDEKLLNNVLNEFPDLSTIENRITSIGYNVNNKLADIKAYEKLELCCKKPKEN